jgi:hypothetical protein
VSVVVEQDVINTDHYFSFFGLRGVRGAVIETM